MTTVHQPTLFHLVDCIKLKKFKLSRSSTPETDEEEPTPSKYWSNQEEHLFFNVFFFHLRQIVLRYGADYSILKHHFTSKSRNQIKKKCIEIEKRRKRAIEKADNRKNQEERKDFFDQVMQDYDMIKWHNSKPNKPENGIESQI